MDTAKKVATKKEKGSASRLLGGQSFPLRHNNHTPSPARKRRSPRDGGSAGRAPLPQRVRRFGEKDRPLGRPMKRTTVFVRDRTNGFVLHAKRLD